MTRVYSVSEETKQKISERAMGHSVSTETRVKIARTLRALSDRGLLAAPFNRKLSERNCSVCGKSFLPRNLNKNFQCSKRCGQVVAASKKRGQVSERRIYFTEQLLGKVIYLYGLGWAITKIAEELNTYHRKVKNNLLWSGVTNIERRHVTGEKCGSWRGGVTSLRVSIRSMPEYAKWRTKVFERDSYKCQICLSTKKHLNVDHIKPFAFILHDNNIKDIKDARQCDELWNIDNGRTLCLDCHRETDSYMNKGKKLLKQHINITV